MNNPPSRSTRFGKTRFYGFWGSLILIRTGRFLCEPLFGQDCRTDQENYKDITCAYCPVLERDLMNQRGFCIILRGARFEGRQTLRFFLSGQGCL